jgi:predicted nucleic acid-binding protein
VTTAIADTGPLLHLHEAEALYLLSSFQTVLIPAAVERELAALVPEWRAVCPTIVSVRSLDEEQMREATAWAAARLIQRGEAEAIALARGLSAGVLLTDDAAARLFAESLGVEVHGSLGVVLYAAATRRVSQEDARRAVERLARTSLWVSPRVLAAAMQSLNVLGGST